MDADYQENTKPLKSKGKPTPCPICGVIICNSYNLSCHLRRHSNVRPFKCEVCGKGFILKSEVKRHSLCHTEERPYECIVCHKKFKDKISLRVHGDSHRSQDYRCRYCDMAFTEYRKFSAHEKQAHNDATHKCKFCYKTFFSDLFKDEHERTVHLRLYKLCNSSKPRVTRKRGRGKAKEIETIKTEPVTLDCNSFASKNVYGPKVEKDRGASDENFKFYRCKVCSERFKYRKDQISHYEKFHKEEYDKTFKVCTICGKLLTLHHFSAHMKVHQGNYDFACSHCDYKSMRRQDLQSHMRTHTKEFLYKCKTCDMPFRSRYMSDICEKKHTGIKDVKCNECDRTFYTLRELKSHRSLCHVIHKCFTCNFETVNKAALTKHNKVEHNYQPIAPKTEKKSLMCDKCGALFNSQQHLTFHLKRHILDNVDWDNRMKKALVCFYCDYQGASSQDILKHSMEFHEAKVYKCVLCTYATLNTKLIKNHMKTHGDDIWQESYFHAKIEQEIEKEEDFADLECFLCGFSSKLQEDMIMHSDCHKIRMQQFEWFPLQSFDTVLYRKIHKRKKKPFKPEYAIRNVEVQKVSENIDLSKYFSEFNNLDIEINLPGIQPRDNLKRVVKQELVEDEIELDPMLDKSASKMKSSFVTNERHPKESSSFANRPKTKSAKTSKSTDSSLELKTLTKDKLDCRSINGKLFLSLEDICSLGALNVNKEELLQLLKIEKED